MHTVVGIDLGTQSVKVVFYDLDEKAVVASDKRAIGCVPRRQRRRRATVTLVARRCCGTRSPGSRLGIKKFRSCHRRVRDSSMDSSPLTRMTM